LVYPGRGLMLQGRTSPATAKRSCPQATWIRRAAAAQATAFPASSKRLSACRPGRQRPPGPPPAVVRCILDSLALAYRRALAQVQELSGLSASVVHACPCYPSHRPPHRPAL